MRRILIFGSAGSGKSTLARALGQRLGLPVTHLDVLFWRPGWVEPDNEGYRARVAESVAGDAWISEGNYLTRTFDLRLPKADTVIWMDTPALTCARRVIWRTLFEQRRPDLPEGCPEDITRDDFLPFLKQIWAFDRTSRPRMEAALAKMRPDIEPRHLRSPRDARRFMAELPSGH